MNSITILFKTLFLYSLTEYQEGQVSKISISIKGNEINITDNGRGHNINKVIDNIPYLKIAYNHLKLPFDSDNMPNIRLDHIGISILNEFSEKLEVIASKKEKIETHIFKNGQFIEQVDKLNVNGNTGNSITFIPSNKIDTTSICLDEVRNYLLSIKKIYTGLTLILNEETLEV